MANLIECPTCKQQISSGAASCPHCGEIIPPPAKIRRIRIIGAIAGVLLIVVGVSMNTRRIFDQRARRT